MKATEDFSITQPTLQEGSDVNVNPDFPFNLLQDLKTNHGSPDKGLETLNDLFATQDSSPDDLLMSSLASQDSSPDDLLMSSADPFLDLVTSEDLPPDLFPSLLDSTFRPGDLLNEGSLTESDIM